MERDEYREQRELAEHDSAIIEARLRHVLALETANQNLKGQLMSMVRQTPKLNGLRASLDSFFDRVEKAAGSVTDDMNDTAQFTEQGAEKMKTVVKQVRDQAQSVHDAADQVLAQPGTNGVPS